MQIDVATVSNFNPPMTGDTVVFDGTEWRLGRSYSGWCLIDTNGNFHPTIKDIDGMSDLIGAILEYSKGTM